MDQEYFTIPEVAARLKVTPAAIRKWIAQGKIEVVYVGSDRRITSDAIAAFVKASTETRRAARGNESAEDIQAPGLVGYAYPVH